MYGYFVEITDEPIICYENAEYYLFDNIEYYETHYETDYETHYETTRKSHREKIKREHERETHIDKWFIEDEPINKKWFYGFFICILF